MSFVNKFDYAEYAQQVNAWRTKCNAGDNMDIDEEGIAANEDGNDLSG
jgi:hypothetical protein